MLVMIYCW